MLDLERWDNIGGWMNKAEGQYLYEQALALPEWSMIVEIGSYRGRSTVALLQACADSSPERRKRLIAVDWFAGTGERVVAPTEESQKEGARLFYETIYAWELHPWLVQLEVMDSALWFEKHPADAGQYDMFFVDGCHPQAEYDVTEAWKRTRAGGGVLLLHDYDLAVALEASPVKQAVQKAGIPGAHCGVWGTSIFRAVR